MLSNFSWARALFIANRYKWWLACLALVIIVTTNLAGLMLPVKYKSTVKVKIYEPREYRRGDRGPTVHDRLITIREEVSSDPFVADVAGRLNLDAGIKPHTPEYYQLLDRIKKHIELWTKGSDLISFSYVSTDPKRAQQVVTTVVNKYLAETNRIFENAQQQKISFLEQELERAERNLGQAQQQVVNYMNEHPNEIPEAQGANIKRLEEARSGLIRDTQQINTLRQNLILARQKLTETPKTIEQVTTEQNNQHEQLQARKRDLAMQLQMLLEDFTEEHWKVKEVRSQLKLVEDQLAESKMSERQTVTETLNPNHQALEDRITQMELELDRLRTRVQERRGNISQLEVYIANIPERRLELEKLQDQRRFAAQRVDRLRQDLYQARQISNEMDLGQGPTFEIISSARDDSPPVSPNRTMIFAASLALAAGVVAALVFLLALLDTAVRSVAEARQVLQMPVLGCVQRIITPSEQRRLRRRRLRRALGLGTGLTALLVAAAFVWMFYSEPLLNGLESVRAVISQQLFR